MRARPDRWFPDLLSAATKVFIAKGYRQTQMSDIAREMGVSQGTLYNYVESKEALFLLACEQGFSDSPPQAPAPPPVPSQSFTTMVERIRERMLSTTRLETLRSALRTRKPVDASTELEGVLREFYSMIARYRHGFDLIERSALEVPEMAHVLFVEGRRGAVDGFARYIAGRIDSGHFRSVRDPATAARFIIEAVTWFARHRHNSAESQTIGDDDALETTIHFLVAGLVAEGRQPARNSRKETPSNTPIRTFKKQRTSRGARRKP